MKKSMLNLKRRISVLLAMAMVFTNTVPGLSTVYADESDKSHFEIDAGQLVEAINDAVSDASLLEEEELELTDGETGELGICFTARDMCMKYSRKSSRKMRIRS